MKIAEYRAAQAAQMTEATFQDDVTDLALDLGWLTFHDHDSRRNPSGFPDLVAVRPGRVLFVELKSARGRFSAEQARWLDALRQTPAEVYVWRPADLLSGLIVQILRGV